MNEIEEYAFKEVRELSNIDKDELLEIIDFLQKDRKQWIEQFTKTHNESIDSTRKYNNLEKENQQLKNELEQSNAVADTNKELAESFHKEIERLKRLLKYDYEDGQTIMAELTNENKHLKEQLQNKQDIINGILDYIDSNKFVEEFKNVVNERNVRNEILNRIEKSDK